MTAKTPASYSESTLSDHYQTTIPKPIRKVLGLNKRDKIGYTIESDGRVVVSCADETNSDPIIRQVLNFLARDMQKNPQHLHAISSDLVSCIQFVVADIDVDLDALLLDEDE
jgi:antitoxin PrlF